MKMKSAAIIGAGLMGSAMSWPLADNGFEVFLVGSPLDDYIIRSCRDMRFHPSLGRVIPENVIPIECKDAASVIGSAELIVSGVSSYGVDWIAGFLEEHYVPGQKIISITKGIRINASCGIELFPEIIQKHLPMAGGSASVVAAVGGPCIAGELAARRQTSVMFGSHDIELARYFTGVFTTDYYHPIPTDDLMSLELCVALKNAYTVAVGCTAGMLETEEHEDEANAKMHNSAAAIFAQGCMEISRMIGILGGKRSYAAFLPGAGDLYVTSAGGRTMKLGRLLGSGMLYSEARERLHGVTLESVMIISEMAKIIPSLLEKKKAREVEFPLMLALIDCIVNNKKMCLPFEKMFNDKAFV